MPLEPIHEHISEGLPTPSATKVWITKTGNCVLANNNSKIPLRKLRLIMRIIEARHEEIISRWFDFFGKGDYYC